MLCSEPQIKVCNPCSVVDGLLYFLGHCNSMWHGRITSTRLGAGQGRKFLFDWLSIPAALCIAHAMQLWYKLPMAISSGNHSPYGLQQWVHFSSKVVSHSSLSRASHCRTSGLSSSASTTTSHHCSSSVTSSKPSTTTGSTASTSITGNTTSCYSHSWTRNVSSACSSRNPSS